MVAKSGNIAPAVQKPNDSIPESKCQTMNYGFSRGSKWCKRISFIQSSLALGGIDATFLDLDSWANQLGNSVCRVGVLVD